MKEKILTAVSAILVIVPWTIFLVRRNPWALESPQAEMICIAYMVEIVLAGIGSLLIYQKGRVQNLLMKLCVTVHVIYLFGAVALAFMMVV